MHYNYYYYEQLLANEKNTIQRHLLTIACEALLMANDICPLQIHIQAYI